MQAHAIDTLAAANSLKEAGIAAKQAEAIAKVFGSTAQMDKDTLATKEDLANAEERLSLKIDASIATAKLHTIIGIGGLLALFKAFDYFIAP